MTQWPFEEVGMLHVDHDGYSLIGEGGQILHGPTKTMAELAEWSVDHHVELRAEDPWE